MMILHLLELLSVLLFDWPSLREPLKDGRMGTTEAGSAVKMHSCHVNDSVKALRLSVISSDSCATAAQRDRSTSCMYIHQIMQTELHIYKQYCIVTVYHHLMQAINTNLAIITKVILNRYFLRHRSVRRLHYEITVCPHDKNCR